MSAVLTKAGTLAFVASNATKKRAPFVHEARGVGAGARLSRIKRKTRPFGKGVRVRRAGGGAKFVYVVRKRRVRVVAVATRSASSTPKRLRAYLRLAGIR